MTSEPRVLLDVPITFDTGDGPTHAPMVHVTIHGTPTKLILDTGSTDHILTVELADQLGLAAEPGEEGTDSTGATVPSWTLGTAAIEIAEQPFELQNVVAITAPAPFPGWGIGGFISPQHLHPTAWAVLDLVGDRFMLLDGDEPDVTAWLTARHSELRLLALDRVAGDETILVQAAIEPFEAVVTMLDSGGKRTTFARSAVPGLEGGERSSSGRGVGGTEAFAVEARGQVLIAGGHRLPLAALLIGDEMEGRAGLVGMDVLRESVLTVSSDPHRPVIWLL